MQLLLYQDLFVIHDVNAFLSLLYALACDVVNRTFYQVAVSVHRKDAVGISIEADDESLDSGRGRYIEDGTQALDAARGQLLMLLSLVDT